MDFPPHHPLVRVRGTRVWLPWPEGFVETVQVPGLSDPRTGSVIVVIELPHPVSAAEFAASRDAGLLKTQGIHLLTWEPLRAGEKEGMLLHVEQSQRGILFDKWMATFRGERGSVMVVASCRKERAPELSPMLRAVVLATHWEPDAEQPDRPPFTLDSPSGFHPAYRVLHGIVFTEDGQMPAPGDERPVLHVSPLPPPPGKQETRTPRELSEAWLERQSLPGVTGVTLESEGPVIAGGMRGYELVAHGRDSHTGRALVVYQLLLSTPSGFVTVQGTASAAQKESLLPRMQSAARSVRRTK